MNEHNDVFTQEQTEKLLRIVTVRLALCSRFASRSGKTIVAKPRKGSVCILDYLERITLEEFFISNYRFFFEPIKSHKNNRGETLRDFIESNGGLRKTIKYMRFFMSGCSNVLGSMEAINYADTILVCCEDAFNLTVRHGLKQTKMALPYCALCWRRIENSKYYCQLHHPKQSSDKYYADRTALFSALKSQSSIHLPELIEYETRRKRSQLAPLMYKWTTSFAERPIKILSASPYINISKNSDWLEIANRIIIFCETTYPITYSIIHKLAPTKNQTWRDWCLSIIHKLDPVESYFWDSREIDDWLDLKSPIPAPFMLLTLLQRYEASEFIKSLPQPRGPKKGTVKINKKIRQQILEIVQDMKVKGLKVVQAEIGRQLGVDRRLINKHFKRLGL